MRVAVAAVRAVLRGWFARWGLPDQIRLDNGHPWGSASDLPPDLVLWLLGLGVGPVWNAPGHKQGNAVVERGHGVCQRWVEPATCRDIAELQARLDHVTALQRERYPYRDGASRLAVCPELAHSGRAYDPAAEAARWDERRAWAWLGERVLHRRVDKVGRVSVANRALGVGRAWAGQAVTVRLAVVDGAPVWRIRDAQGAVLRQHPAPELGRERILALAVSRRPQRGKPSAQHEA